MPAKDIFHDCCKEALLQSGWQVTHDPYNLKGLILSAPFL